MSKVTIESRMCDSCERTYDSTYPAWMTLTFPNVQQEEAPEFDFCTYECLENWVNEDDAADEPEATLAVVPSHNEQLMAALDAQDSPPPPFAGPQMTLADALANGLRPGNPV